jgi:3',5'-cyclic AMP phosphodiesterase CpdA
MPSIHFTGKAGSAARLTLACLVFFLGLTGAVSAQAAGSDALFFVQVSDTHWGFNNPRINPDYAGTLKKGIAEINSLQNIRTIKFIPGEHDAGLDNAEAYREFFGDPHYTFDVKGVHFVVLDNVSTPDGSLGDAPLQWLAGVLQGYDKDSQIIIFAHRPLMTKDGAKALALFKPFRNVKLFYGHIHQEREDSEDGFAQYAAPGMMFSLPAPGSVASPNPVAWDAAHPYQGLGFRTVSIDLKTYQATIKEYSINPGGRISSN